MMAALTFVKRFDQLVPGHVLAQPGDKFTGVINGIWECYIAHRDECIS